jgi:DNA-binding beta-propeller fold protein YncE
MIRNLIFAAAGLATKIFGFNLSTATAVSTFTYGSGQPEDHIVRDDGTKYYLLQAGNDRVQEFNLSTPYSVQSRSLVSNLNLPNYPSGIFFKPDGTKLYVVSSNTNRVYSYSLATAWVVSTATQDSFNRSFGFQVQGVALSNDGSLIFFANNSNNRIDTYTLSTPWDLSTISTNALRTFSIGVSVVRAVTFNHDGTKMYTGSGLFNGRVREFVLSTPYDTSTATFNYDLSVSLDYVSGISFAQSGFKMYLIDFNSTRFREYNLT